MGPPALKSSALPIRLQSPYINIMKNSWYKSLVYISMAQLVTANPKLFSRAFRICSQSVWELKIHKIRRQGTVPNMMIVKVHPQ